MLVYYFLPFIVNNHYFLFQVSSGHNSVNVQNRTHVRMNFSAQNHSYYHIAKQCRFLLNHPVYHSYIPRNSRVSKTDISTLHLLLHKTILCKQTLYNKTTFISYPLITWLIQRIFTDRNIHIPKHSKKVWNGNISINIQNDGIFRKATSKM